MQIHMHTYHGTTVSDVCVEERGRIVADLESPNFRRRRSVHTENAMIHRSFTASAVFSACEVLVLQ